MPTQQDIQRMMMQTVLGGGQNWAKGLASRRQVQQMPEKKRLERGADVPAVEKFLELYQVLNEEDRVKALKQFKARLDTNTLALLQWHLNRVGEAPAAGISTWRRPGTFGAMPEAAGGALQQALMGRTPGLEHQLALGQLPREQRGAEWARRAGPLERRYPGATRVGETMIPTGTEGVLDPVEAIRQRVKEGGGWQAVTDITEKWPKTAFWWEKEKTIEEAAKKGLLNERQIAALKTFIDRTEVPDWVGQWIPKSAYNLIGVKQDEAGVLSSAVEGMSDLDAAAATNLRVVLSTPIPTLDVIQKMPRRRELQVVAFGEEMLSQGEKAAIGGGTSGLPYFITRYTGLVKGEPQRPLVELPLEDSDEPGKLSANWLRIMTELLRYFGPDEVMAIFAMVQDRTIRSGLTAAGGR